MTSYQEFTVQTSQQNQLVEITRQVAQLVTASGMQEGICRLYTPHTTCGLTINEHADPDVAHDLLLALDQLIPSMSGFRHSEGNSPAHVKTALVGVSQQVFISGGKLALGTWQGIFLCEFDGPRRRRVWVSLMPME